MKHLNTTADDICSVVGYSATSAICAWFENQNLYVPKEAVEDHPLTRLIGISAFKRLCEAFGGDHLAVPAGRREARDLRDRAIAGMMQRGISVEDIAQITGLTPRRIDQIKTALEQSGMLGLVKNPGAESLMQDRPSEKLAARLSGQKPPSEKSAPNASSGKPPSKNQQQKSRRRYRL